MNSRQINFFLTPRDQEELEAAFNQINSFVVLGDRVESGKPFKLNDMKIIDMKNDFLWIVLVKETDINYIILDTIYNQTYKTINIDKSPVVEFHRCRYIDNMIHRGRMYVVNSFYDGNFLRKKESNFLKWSSSLFRVARKTLTKNGDSLFYYGKEASRLRESSVEFVE
jgi:hypothetical protein